MKKIIYILSMLISMSSINAFNESDIDPNTSSIITISSWWSAFDILNSIFSKIISHIFSISALLITGVLIYVGYLFITSDWDQAQFKKAWKAFIYAVIWIVIIILSWSAVKLITTIGI